MNQLDQLNQYRATRIFSYSDARTMARRRLPRLVFDYMEGAAGDELAMARNRKALDAVLLSPRSLVDVDQRTLKTSFLKQDWDLPFGIAPMGMCNLAGPGTDQHFASAATHHNIPLGHSTAASSNIESMAAQTGDKLWFQLYVGQSIELGLQLVQRAKDSGCQTLILTVDVPEVAQRLRDKRNGFKAPLKIGPKQFLDFAFHPQWSLTTLAAGVPELANFKNDDGSTQQFNREDGRGKLTWEFLKQLREIWKGNLVIKGIMHTDDARQAADHGVDAIYVSNHGGRQLDSAPASITRLIVLESVILTSVAGYVGLIGSLGLLELLKATIGENDFMYQPDVSTQVVLLVTLLVIVAGTLAGYLPARRAASINPVEALQQR